jgi:hypothetical protein
MYLNFFSFDWSVEYVCRKRRDSRKPMSKSPSRRATPVSDHVGDSPDVEVDEQSEGGEEFDDTERTAKQIKLLLQKLLSGGAALSGSGLDQQLEKLLMLQPAEISSIDSEKHEIASAHRLRQTHAGAFYGWRNVQEMTVKLNDDVNALEKRVERRRHVEDLEPWRQKNNVLRRNSTPEPSSKQESPLEQRVRAALRNSLLGTNGEPRTARCLKRAVLEQWTRVLEHDQDQDRQIVDQNSREETVRMVLDLEFTEVSRNLAGFNAALHKDVCCALGTSSRYVKIRNVEAGSVIVTLDLMPAADGRSAQVSIDSHSLNASVIHLAAYTCSK